MMFDDPLLFWMISLGTCRKWHGARSQKVANCRFHDRAEHLWGESAKVTPPSIIFQQPTTRKRGGVLPAPVLSVNLYLTTGAAAL